MSVSKLHKAVRDAVTIEPAVIQEEYVRLPGDLAYWGAQYAAAYKDWQEAKVQRELVTAQLTAEHRVALEAKSKRVTVGEVEAAVTLDQRWVEAKGVEIRAETEKIEVQHVVEALRAKRDMLVSLGAHYRMEMENDPVIRRQRALDREINEANKQA